MMVTVICFVQKAKSEQDQSVVGTELVKFNSDFNEVSVTEM